MSLPTDTIEENVAELSEMIRLHKTSMEQPILGSAGSLGEMSYRI